MRLLEVIVSSVADAVEAERGGAGRLEICRDLDQEGLTPTLDMVREIMALVSIPVRVMIRERNTFDVASPEELDRMCADARACADMGVPGLVIGFERDGRIDHEPVVRMLEAAPSCRITFHRALEATRDPMAAMAELKRYPQVDRVLAGGGSGSWPQRLVRLLELQRRGAPQIGLLPGAGVNCDVLRLIAATPGLPEAHVGRAAREPATAAGRVSAAKVADLVQAFSG